MLLFFYGENTFESHKKLLQLKERFLKTDEEGMNLVELEGAGLTWSSLAKEIETMPFLGAKRLVIIKNLLSEGKDKKLQDKIGESLATVPESVVLVFWERGIPDRRLKLFKTLSKIAQKEEFNLLEGFALNQWITKIVSERGGKINPVAVNQLIMFVGNDLWQLSNEINKLIAYADGKEIQIKDVELLVTAKIDENIFRLTDAFGKKDRKQAIQILDQFLFLGVRPEYLVGMLGGHLRNLIQIKALAMEGHSPIQIQKITHLHPYLIQKTLPQTRLFTLDQLKRLYQKLAGVDEQIKRSQIKPQVALDLLMFLT